MNPEIKKKWVEALRSGQYVQGRNKLRSPSSNDPDFPAPSAFCCLGVLCDVVDSTQWQPPMDRKPDYMLYGYHSTSTPPDVLDTSGLGRTDEDALVKLNDDERWTFNQIADWIEENL